MIFRPPARLKSAVPHAQSLGFPPLSPLDGSWPGLQEQGILRAAEAKTSRQIIVCRIEELKPYKHNARTHSKKQIRQIVASIERFGFVNPVLDGSEIVAGTDGSKRPGSWG